MPYWARDARWKLYHDGRLYDTEAGPTERSPVDLRGANPEAAAARKRLVAVFAEVKAAPELVSRNPSKGKTHDE